MTTLASKPVSTPTQRVAIVGHPNSGKTTIFNALTGLRHKVANYPGVTVERREARLLDPNCSNVTLVDLPGAYSLVPRSVDERVSRDVLLGLMNGVRPIDAVLIVIDAGNLSRNLYLVSQLIDLNFPCVLCCNMMDSVRAEGVQIDFDLLSQRLGIPVVPTVGNRREGIEELKRDLLGLNDVCHTPCALSLPQPLTIEIENLRGYIQGLPLGRPGGEVGLARLLLASVPSDDGEVELSFPAELVAEVDEAARRLGAAGISEASGVIVQARYAFLRGIVSEVVTPAVCARSSMSDRVDRIVTHPILGLLVFGMLMFIMFLSIFSWAAPLMDGIEGLLSLAVEFLAAHMSEGILRSLLVDGVIAGVGAVLVFLPQICILFFFLCLLEDSGYMARAAMLMNRVMTKIGLPGKSFIPLLSSFACAIPGIMATRTIEHHRDRLVTILIAPFMSCSARLPVYIILIGALFAGSVWLQAGIMLSMYTLGIGTALIVAFVLKRTLFRGKQRGFIIELPPYRRPQLRVVLQAMWERSSLFLKDAGTIIFAVTIILWLLAYFPRADARAVENDPGLQLRQSVMGRIGRAIEPVIRPLGFDWKIGVGLTASFAAREVFVSTMGVVYGVGEADETSPSLRAKLAADTWPDGRKIYTPLVGISLMAFYVLACQCVSTLGVVRRETGSWCWPIFMFTYMTVLAYLASLTIFQVGSALGWG